MAKVLGIGPHNTTARITAYDPTCDSASLLLKVAAVQGELDRFSQTLTGRIRQLAERYATPLPQLTDEVATLATRVDEHLAKMGRRY